MTTTPLREPFAHLGAEPWTIEASRTLYNIEGWGNGYYDINSKGHVVVRPDRDERGRELDLFELAMDLEAQGVGMPLLIRFSDILRSRIADLHDRFMSAIKEFEYTGGYTTIYPIKVNQQRHVVEEIVEFGLRASQLVRVIDKLTDAGYLDCVHLLHFHLGSQITDIRYIKAGLQEIARYYSELRKMGVDVTHVDVGGGLGVDYDGTRSTAYASVNYTLQEYANDIVYTLAEACREEELPMPHIISESGRALTAHHALLLLSVIDVESVTEVVAPELTEGDHALLHEMAIDLETVNSRRLREVFHDATFDKERAQQLFASGVLSLRDRARAEQLHLAIINSVAREVRKDREEYSEIVEDLEAMLVDRYFCNFSLFQSLPDSWAIDQIFPIMPVHRLDEEPVRRGTIQDVTCD